jgi:hypothetical protein
MKFQIMAERCNECLFSKNKIVSKERKAEIIREITSGQGSWFHCHKTSGVACRGDWDKYGCGNIGRVAARIGAVEFVTLNPDGTTEVTPPASGGGQP